MMPKDRMIVVPMVSTVLESNRWLLIEHELLGIKIRASRPKVLHCRLGRRVTAALYMMKLVEVGYENQRVHDSTVLNS